MPYVHQKYNERYATDIARYTKTRKRKYTDMGAPFADDSPLHRYYALYMLRRSAISASAETCKDCSCIVVAVETTACAARYYYTTLFAIRYIRSLFRDI